MEFSVATVDINYAHTLRRKSNLWSESGYQTLVFEFTCSRFVSLSILANLKLNRDYVEYIKSCIINSIRTMSEQDFEIIKAEINRHAAECYYHDSFVMKLVYNRNQAGNITFTMKYSSFKQEIQSRDDLILAAERITSKDLMKES